MNKSTRSRGVSENFLKEVSDKLHIIGTLSKDSGVEVPNELEETLKELSISSHRQSPGLSSCSSMISELPKDSFIELPAPSDTSHLNSSIESASIKQLKTSNNQLCKAVKDKLEEFRSLNKQSRNYGAKATIELKNYQNELKDMKSSVIEIIDEANSTKEQIIKMKEKLEIEHRNIDASDNYFPDKEKYEEYDMSFFRGNGQDSNLLLEQIKELDQEIKKIQSRIEQSEQDLKQKEHENQELKTFIEKLNESFEKMDKNTEESSASCQNCLVF
jgi:uncharacterized phage infection (PIP) family protein YhgE